MLYALGDPVSFVLLLVSFVVAVTFHGWVQSVVAHRAGDRTLAAEGRLRPDPRRHVDPFGAIAAAIAGTGWARPVVSVDGRQRGRVVTVALSGAVGNLVVGAAALVAFRALGGPTVSAGTVALQQGVAGDLALRAALLFGLSNVLVGLLSLVPLPPLDGGRLMFALAPRTPGWQKAEYHLVERNIGTAVLLALLLIPLGGPQALLPAVLDAVVRPAVEVLTGG